MNPFYALNKTLDDIRNEPTQEQKALVESQVPKSPAKKTLEEALRSDLRSLMEDGTGGMSGSNTLEAKDKSLSQAAKTVKKGALHKQEGIPQDEKIGNKKLQSLKKSGTPLEKKRANFALNIQGKGKKKVNEWETDPDEKEAEMIDSWYDSVEDGLVNYGIKIPVPAERINQVADKICNDLDGCYPEIVEKIILSINSQYMHDKASGDIDEDYGNVNELSKKTLASYAKRASGTSADNSAPNLASRAAYKLGSDPTGDDNGDADDTKAFNRARNVSKAIDRLTKEEYEDVNELSHGTVTGYKSKAQSDLRKLKQQPVDDFVSNMRQGHRVGDAANMAVQSNLKAIKKAKTRGAGLDRAKSRLDGEYASEGATPDQLDKQKRLQMDRAAATRRNSRAVQQQPAQGGPRRSEVPAFIRKGRGDPGLDHNDLEETNMYSESDKDILDYLKAKLVPTGGNARAKSRPYNGSAGASDAYNGMEFEEAESRFDKREVSPGRTQYTRKYDPDTGHSIGTDSGDSAPAASDGPRKRGRQPGTKFSGGYAARHDGSHVSKAKMDSRKKDMDEEDEYSRHTASKSPAGGTVYTRKYDPDTGHSIGTDTGSSAPAASDGPRKRGRQAGTKFSGGYAARHDGSHVSKAKMDSRKKDMDEGSATCPHCGHAMADEGREVDMEGVKGGMGSFVKAAKKIGGVASAVKKAKKDYDGDGKIETGPEEHAGSVDKAIKANKAKPAAKSADKPKAKPAKQTKEGAKPDFLDVDKDGDKKEPMKKAAKEKKVDETITSGSVATAPAKKSSGGNGVGKGIYDSWERKYESLLKEDVNVTTNSSKNDSGEEEEHITIDVSGDDVARIKEMLHSMGVSHGDEAGHEHGDEACDSCGGVPCQCDEMDEETSFKDAGATIGRIGGTIAGGLGGAAAGLGIGTVPGAIAGGIAGGSAGSALGTAAGRFLDRKTGAPEETDECMAEGHSEECTTCGGTGEGQSTDIDCYDCHGLGHRDVHNDDNYDDAERRDSNRADGMGRIMQLAGLGETSITVSDNEPDYPSNQEYSNDEMQYSGGLNDKKSTGQATLPVVASQVNRLHSHVSEGQRMNDLYKAIAAIEDKEV